jgi:hypothetical protein
MGFGLNAKVDVPKVEAPKVPAAPKVDIAGAVSGAAAGLKGAVAGAAAGVAAGAKAAVGGALGAAGGIAVSLKSVAGALAEVAVSFKGGTEDVAMEPHMVLDANAGFEETKFEKGAVWIRVDMPPDKAKASGDTLHLFTESREYDKKQKISAYKEAGGNTVDVVFEDAPMDQSFSLEVFGDKGQVHAIFAKVPYGELRKTKNRY